MPTPSWFNDAKEELSFFAGFHDGDGCVEACADVRIHQATDNRQPLDRLLEVFGGALGPKPEDKRGERAPSLLWRLRLDESIKYAKAIAPYSLQSRKRGDLELMAAYRDSGISRKNFAARIKSARQTPDDEIDYDSVRARMTGRQIDAYLAGFFFADGNASLNAEGVKATRESCARRGVSRGMGSRARCVPRSRNERVKMSLSQTPWTTRSRELSRNARDGVRTRALSRGSDNCPTRNWDCR